LQGAHAPNGSEESTLSDVLDALGWSAFQAANLDDDASLVVGRVAVEHRGSYTLLGDRGELRAEVPGRLKHGTSTRAELPAVGDWVITHADRRGVVQIKSVLPRSNTLSRKIAGRTTEEQVLVANVDLALITVSCHADLKPHRIERYVTLAWSGGAPPILVLTKADTSLDLTEDVRDVRSAAMGIPVIVTSAINGLGLEDLRARLRPNRTAVVLGPSGAGKSSLVNALLDEERLGTREVRADGKGRHVTSRRELVVVPGGGILIDTPGLREIALWADESGLDASFKDVALLAESCRFNDCTHDHEPDCAVREAIQAGDLAPERLAAYQKLQRELRRLRARQVARKALERHRRRRNGSRSIRRL
jgi:ribosome biogenesis GTPase